MSPRPDWVTATRVVDIYSVSGCISKNFAEYIPYWKHNGYWFFDSPAIIQGLARENAIDLQGTHLFYYEVYEHEFDEIVDNWMDFEPEDFPTQVIAPQRKVLAGYDVVGFSVGTSAECSPLSCNDLAADVETNSHCLLASFEQARESLERGMFKDTEPGPFRVFAVYSVPWS